MVLILSQVQILMVFPMQILMVFPMQILMVHPKEILMVLKSQESQLTLMVLLIGMISTLMLVLFKLDLRKVGSIPGSSKQTQPESTAEIVRRHQWVNDWHLPLKISHLNMHMPILSIQYMLWSLMNSRLI